MRLILFTFLLFTLVNCTNKKEDHFVKEKASYSSVKEIGELSTVEYTLGKVLKIDDKAEWYKFGDRKILIKVNATVKAGINLNKLNTEDLIIEENSIQIRLPEPELFTFTIPSDQVQTVVNDINGLRHEFSQTDKISILQLGEKKIREEVKQTDILNDAEKNAINWFTAYYKNMGYKSVEVSVKRSLL